MTLRMSAGRGRPEATGRRQSDAIDPGRTCKSDILWQNDGGQARAWQMNDARFSSETRRGSVFHPSIALDQWLPKMSA